MEHVGRVRAGRHVVRDINLTLEHGQVLGLLGVNGAGKSTTLALLAGALRPSAGRIVLAGKDLAEYPDQVRQQVGWLPERTPLWPELTIIEHLRAHARLRGLASKAARAACTRILERLQLTDLARRQARVLSQGQRQRVGLAVAMLHQPPLLILDEPGNGLDPVQAIELRTLIREHADHGGAVLLSTHLLTEVAAVCDRVAIVHEGRLRHDGPVDDRLESTFMAIATRTEVA